jgi:hypothetical protein
MDFLERLRFVGPAFVVFDLNVAYAPLPPLTGYSDEVQEIGNARPEGRFPGNACEHEGGAFMHDAKHIRVGSGACHGPGALPHSNLARTLEPFRCYDWQMHFKIVGSRAGRQFSDTRSLPASAAVLGLKWIARGIENVRIIQTGGSTYSVSEFQKRFLAAATRSEADL